MAVFEIAQILIRNFKDNPVASEQSVQSKLLGVRPSRSRAWSL